MAPKKKERMPAAIGVMRPRFLRGLEDLLGMYRGDLCVLERIGKSGRTTFALAMDRGGREFPTVIQGDLPLREIKRFVQTAKKGARILTWGKRSPDIRGILDAYDNGVQCLEETFFIPVEQREATGEALG